MKKLLFLFPALFLLFGFISQKYVDDKLKSLLQQFKISEENAKSTLLSDITGPSFYIPNVKVLKSMALNDRTEMVTAIGNEIKEYVNSPEFINKYNEYRENRKPSEPEKPKYSDQLKEEQKASLNNSIKEMEANMKNLPADQKPMFEDIIKQFKQQLKDIDDPEKSMYTPQMDDIIEQGYDQQLEYYNADVKNWESDYPINNPKPLIKKWIEEFLSKSKDIDFNAQLKTVNNKQVFVKQEYERKDHQWKLFFRAGKEPVDAARKFANNWLSELK